MLERAQRYTRQMPRVVTRGMRVRCFIYASYEARRRRGLRDGSEGVVTRCTAMSLRCLRVMMASALQRLCRASSAAYYARHATSYVER